MTTELTVNGRQQVVDLRGDENLLTALRDVGQTSVKGACEEGECGSCSVLLDDELVCSCLVLAADAQGCRIVTTEGLSPAVGVNEVQDALLSRSGVQCGFCTPGFVVAITDLLAKNPKPSEADVREGLAGNLCRCTGYQSILDAVLSISESSDDHA